MKLRTEDISGCCSFMWNTHLLSHLNRPFLVALQWGKKEGVISQHILNLSNIIIEHTRNINSKYFFIIRYELNYSRKKPFSCSEKCGNKLHQRPENTKQLFTFYFSVLTVMLWSENTYSKYSGCTYHFCCYFIDKKIVLNWDQETAWCYSTVQHNTAVIGIPTHVCIACSFMVSGSGSQSVGYGSWSVT